MKVTFRKLYNEHQRLRDEIIDGECEEKAWPKVGIQFWMTGPPRDAGVMRWVQTSPITKILFTNEAIIIFQTESGSVYSVEKQK